MQIGSALFPTLHSFNVVLARPRSVHLHGVVAGGATIEQCAQQVQESEVTRLVLKVQTSNSFCFSLCLHVLLIA